MVLTQLFFTRFLLSQNRSINHNVFTTDWLVSRHLVTIKLMLVNAWHIMLTLSMTKPIWEKNLWDHKAGKCHAIWNYKKVHFVWNTVKQENFMTGKFREFAASGCSWRKVLPFHDRKFSRIRQLSRKSQRENFLFYSMIPYSVTGC